MLGFLHRNLPAVGRVLYPGAIPPPLDRLTGLRPPVTCTPSETAPHQLWAVKATHPKWGSAEIVCDRDPAPLPDVLIDVVLNLTDAEKTRARLGNCTVAVRVPTQQRQVLRDRKRLLFWLRTLMQDDGVIAIDGTSTLLWSASTLDDELAHDADLDIESLYAIHAIRDPRHADRTSWLHTHGLEELGAFDVDALEPSPLFVSNCGDPMRAIAFAALEGSIEPATARFELARPGGEVRFVPVDQFHDLASTEHQALREVDAVHSGRRAVICEPAGGLLARWRTRPVPSRFLSAVNDDRFVFPFSTAATALMSERARQTLRVFGDLREEFDSLELPTLVKLGYAIEGGAPDDREHLWFEVHRVLGDKVDATLANAPHRVPELKAGQRGEFDLCRLSDWTILSPEGSMTPRNINPARRLRESRSTWQARIDAAKRGGN